MYFYKYIHVFFFFFLFFFFWVGFEVSRFNERGEIHRVKLLSAAESRNQLSETSSALNRKYTLPKCTCLCKDKIGVFSQNKTKGGERNSKYSEAVYG